MKEGGFFDCWRSAVNRKLLKDFRMDLDLKHDGNFQYTILSLEQLQSTLCMFTIGNIISSIIFLTELTRKCIKVYSENFRFT